MKLIQKLLTTVIGLLGITLLFWLGLIYDRLPAGWPNYQVKLPFGMHFTLHAPLAGSLTAARAQVTVYRLAEAKAAAHAKVVVARDAQINTASAQHDQQAQAAIVVRYRTNTKEIIHYVTPQVDARFPIPWSLVRVYNGGATGVDLSAVPLPTGAADDAASTVTASQLGTGITGNDQRCVSNAQRLTDLQGWVTQVVATHAQ